MSLAIRVSLAIALASIVSCAGLVEPPVETHFEFDRRARFDGLERFDFYVLPDSAPRDDRIDAPLFNARVQRAVQAVLEARGFVRDASGRPDFWIVHHAVLDTGVDIQHFVDLDVFGYRPWAQRMRMQEVVRDFDEGLLMLDIIEPRSRSLMWRGYAETRVDLEAESSERVARVRELIAEMLAKFPPGNALR